MIKLVLFFIGKVRSKDTNSYRTQTLKKNSDISHKSNDLCESFPRVKYNRDYQVRTNRPSYKLGIHMTK